MLDSILLILLIVIVITLIPAYHFFIGYFIGFLAKITIGTFLVTGIQQIFHINITLDQIPLLFGIISTFSMFFKTFNRREN